MGAEVAFSSGVGVDSTGSSVGALVASGVANIDGAVAVTTCSVGGGVSSGLAVAVAVATGSGVAVGVPSVGAGSVVAPGSGVAVGSSVESDVALGAGVGVASSVGAGVVGVPEDAGVCCTVASGSGVPDGSMVLVDSGVAGVPVVVLTGGMVAVGVGRGVSVGWAVGVSVGRGVGVFVGRLSLPEDERVGVLVDAGTVHVGVAVGCGVGVYVAVGCGVGVYVAVGVSVGVYVMPAVTVGVAVGASVGVAVGVSSGDAMISDVSAAMFSVGDVSPRPTIGGANCESAWCSAAVSTVSMVWLRVTIDAVVEVASLPEDCGDPALDDPEAGAPSATDIGVDCAMSGCAAEKEDCNPCRLDSHSVRKVVRSADDMVQLALMADCTDVLMLALRVGSGSSPRISNAKDSCKRRSACCMCHAAFWPATFINAPSIFSPSRLTS